MEPTNPTQLFYQFLNPISTCPKTITLAFGQKCTVIYTFTPVGIGPKENLDSGITSETTLGIFCPNHANPNSLAQTLRVFFACLLLLFPRFEGLGQWRELKTTYSKSNHRSTILDISEL